MQRFTSDVEGNFPYAYCVVGTKIPGEEPFAPVKTVLSVPVLRSHNEPGSHFSNNSHVYIFNTPHTSAR